MTTTDRVTTPSPDMLEPVIAAVETRLAALAQALLEREHLGVERAATELQRALALALDAFTRAAQRGGVPPALHQRLARASGQVAAQRETLARATAALDRALDNLLPRPSMGYTASGGNSFASSAGVARA